MDELVELLDKGWDISFKLQPKRFDGGWHARYVWKANRFNVTLEPKWEGFETPEDCVEDAINILSTE